MNKPCKKYYFNLTKFNANFPKVCNTSLQIGFYKKIRDLASGNAVPVILCKVPDVITICILQGCDEKEMR